MGRRGKPEPLVNIKTKGEKMTITFNVAGWTELDTTLLKWFALHRDMPVGEFLGKSMQAYGRATTRGDQASYDRFLKIMEGVANVEERRAAGENIAPVNIFPKEYRPK